MRSRNVLMLVGLAILTIAPTSITSKIVADYETVNQTPTITKEIKSKENIEEVEFISVHQEEIIEEVEESEYIGKFTLTYYCGCRICNGKWTGMPAKNGEPLQEGYTVAVDHNIIPLNTWLYIDGIGYRMASDTGSAIKGNKIDVYLDNHDLCYELGVTENVQVWIKGKDGD